jgi:hypothetical protein
MGNRPETEVGGLRLSKGDDLIHFEWDSSGDPYHDRYRLRAAASVVPFGEGSFPDDPQFDVVFEDYWPGAEIDMYAPFTYFLVTDVGVTGAEGPSGRYGN